MILHGCLISGDRNVQNSFLGVCWRLVFVLHEDGQPSPTPVLSETNQHSQILPDPLNVTVSLMSLDCLRPELRRDQVSRKLTSIT